ncbi:hypothetical protein LMG28727_00837 [Paraburkholderia kirstenboschensis]|uniref:hypothetical protein n=1 Tax=Paraburkholderia kirstenboschensis TaxID=1245436 RepID=UPI000B2085F0|nr:hypothetical protein [Paraburkholderia kirstenboschensis]CAD6514095.1 hypothetical protein LMG28727_00837 [Paraburkholderia kirstenboschensis]
MTAQKITDEAWAGARERYETEPGLGLGKIAQLLDCSKNLVARKAKERGWQKGIGVPVQVHGNAAPSDSKVTGNPVHPATRAPYVYAPEPSTAPSRVAADVFVPPAAAQTPAPSYADDPTIPEGLDAAEREDFVKAAILARQKAINARHVHETKAARSQVYAAMKKVGTEGGAGAALAVMRIVQALRNVQDAEMEAELERVRLSLSEFAGKPKGPMPARVTVLLVKEDVRQVVEVADAAEGMRLGNGWETEIIDVH